MIPTKDPAFLLDGFSMNAGRMKVRRNNGGPVTAWDNSAHGDASSAPPQPTTNGKAQSAALAAAAAAGVHTKSSATTTEPPAVTDEDSDGCSMVAELSSTGSSPSSGADVKLLRYHCLDAPVQWSAFVRLRKSWGELSLTDVQHTAVQKAIEKVRHGHGSINDAHPFVSAIVDRHCPDLKPVKAGPREGATFMLLAVLTGDTTLLRTCLDLKGNPNDVRFLSEPHALQSYVRHGLSPFFMACVCERVDCMTILHDHGASLHISDRWGRTPLHAAAALGNAQVVEWLLNHGAPRLVTDRDAFRPGELCVGKVVLPGADTHVLLQPESRLLFAGGVPPPQPPTTANGAKHEDAESDVSGGGGLSSAPPLPPCSCGSERPRGLCGCFDDMHLRWFADRVASQWIPSEFIDAISNTVTVTTERTQQGSGTECVGCGGGGGDRAASPAAVAPR